MAKKKATSSDVAARAGVSQATVSMVLNRKYNVSFSRETVERVEQAARELGYELPGRRKHKADRKEKLIVVFCPTLTSPYYVLLLQGLSLIHILMEYYSSHINKLIEQLSHLPGIGAKSAQRLAFHIMNMPKDQVEQLTASITDARQNVQYCKCCYTLTDQELCPICANPKRDHSTIMVVENTRDLAAYEKRCV